MAVAREKGWQAVAKGICEITACTGKASSAHRDRKYRHLTALLSDLGLLKVPPDLDEYIYATRRQGLTKCLEGLTPTATNPNLEVVYVQPLEPSESDTGVITFQYFANVIEKLDDPGAALFATFLRKWTVPPASTPPHSQG